MKKLIFGIAILTTTSVISFAQNKNTPAAAPATQQFGREKMQETAKANAQKEVDRLEKPLQLSENQKQAVYGITMKWSMVGQSGNMDKQKVQEMKDDQMKHALSPEQYAKYKAMDNNK